MLTGEREIIIKEPVITETTKEPLICSCKSIAKELEELNKLIQDLLEDLKKHTWGA